MQSFILRASGTLVPSSTVATGGAAKCWLVSDGSLLFAGNAGSGTESWALGIVDEFHIGPAGTLTEVGSVTVSDVAGGEGIAVT